jgi:hypothetical protein
MAIHTFLITYAVSKFQNEKGGERVMPAKKTKKTKKTAKKKK